MSEPSHANDSWSHLRRFTEARIALGRAGGSLPTAELLKFSVAHAAARDAVHENMDVDQLDASLAAHGLPTLHLSTQVVDRMTYLLRPDLGRRLDDESRERLRSSASSGVDVVLIVADGLSAPAAHRQAPPVILELVPRLRSSRLTIGPICIVRQARVAVEDEIGSILGARVAVILIGERPGLGTAESLGAYLVYDPQPGRNDAERNCVSNIRPGGLSAAAGAEAIHYLITESLRRKISGIALKDERVLLPNRGREFLSDGS